MGKYFFSSTHKECFLNMMVEDDMAQGDAERLSLFYIISGNEDLYRKRRYIYDPCEHCIRTCFDNTEVDFSSGMKSLIRLGFNLYNGWSDRYTTPMSLLGSLDNRNLRLAGNAIMTRFNSNFRNGLIE